MKHIFKTFTIMGSSDYVGPYNIMDIKRDEHDNKLNLNESTDLIVEEGDLERAAAVYLRLHGMNPVLVDVPGKDAESSEGKTIKVNLKELIEFFTERHKYQMMNELRDLSFEKYIDTYGIKNVLNLTV